MRQPQSLEDAKAIFREERAKARSAFNTLIGSRPVLAVLTLGMISLGTRLLMPSERTQLPSVEGLSLATFGLPPLDFGALGQGASEVWRSATQNGATEAFSGFVAENPDAVPWINGGLFVACVILLALNFAAAAQKWKGATGITIGTPR